MRVPSEAERSTSTRTGPGEKAYKTVKRTSAHAAATRVTKRQGLSAIASIRLVRGRVTSTGSSSVERATVGPIGRKNHRVTIASGQLFPPIRIPADGSAPTSRELRGKPCHVYQTTPHRAQAHGQAPFAHDRERPVLQW